MIQLQLVPNSIEFLEMSDERYFSDEYKNCISNSKLTLINPEQGGSVELYKAGFGASKPSQALVLGSAVHEVVLQGEEFELNTSVTNKPTAKMGLMADELFKKFKKNVDHIVTDEDIIEASDKVGYYAGKMDAKKIDDVKNSCTPYWYDRYLHEIKNPDDLRKKQIFLDTRQQEQAGECITSLQTNPQVQKLLHPVGTFEDPLSMNEAALFFDVIATDTETGKSKTLKIKGKLDNFTIDTETNSVVLNDLKTTGHKLVDFKNSVVTWHYPRQFGLYAYMLKEYAKKYHNIDPDSLTVNLLVVSTLPPYSSGVYKLTKEEVEAGWKEFVHLLKMAAAVELEEC